MSDRFRRARLVVLACCLVGAPLAEVVEQLISPLTGGSTADDFAAIAAAPERFTVAVVVGLIGTALLLPALLGLASRASVRTPVLALVATAVAAISVLGFAGVRMSQAFEGQLATGGLPPDQAVAQFDAAVASPVGVTMLIAFLGGTVVGVVLFAIALWRSRQAPVGAIILMLFFPVADLVAPTGVGTVVSHVVLLAAFGWMAVALLRRDRLGAAPVGEPTTA